MEKGRYSDEEDSYRDNNVTGNFAAGGSSTTVSKVTSATLHPVAIVLICSREHSESFEPSGGPSILSYMSTSISTFCRLNPALSPLL